MTPGASAVTRSEKDAVASARQLVEARRHILLFSQFTSKLDLIKPMVADGGIEFVELRGSTTDRAHRIGQDKPIFVYEFVAQGTVEERMLELQQRKKARAAGIYEAGGNAAAALNAADIERLFSCGHHRTKWGT